MSVEYEFFMDMVSEEYWKLPSLLREDLEVYFDVEKCTLHKREYSSGQIAYDTMANARRCDSKSGKGMIMICFQSHPKHLLVDREHFRRLLIHESEHCFSPETRHSEHIYPPVGNSAQKAFNT